MYEAAASCKDIARTLVTNSEPHGVTLVGYSNAVRYGMKVQLVTPYRVSHLQRYGVTVRGNVTSVDVPLRSVGDVTCFIALSGTQTLLPYQPHHPPFQPRHPPEARNNTTVTTACY